MKIDPHVHSEEISPCGRIPVAELIPLYRKAGYDAIVLSNHCNSHAAGKWAEKTGRTDFGVSYLETFRKAEAIGKKEGLLVLCGCELRFDDCDNDYLIFGITEEMLLDCRKYFAMKIDSFSEIAAEKGILIYQAHPFRNRMKIINPAVLFGMEVKNTHPRHDSRNEIANAWADKYHLHKLAGSDCHQLEDVGTSGIRTDADVRTMADLVEVLKNDNFTFL